MYSYNNTHADKKINQVALKKHLNLTDNKLMMLQVVYKSHKDISTNQSLIQQNYAGENNHISTNDTINYLKLRGIFWN